MLTSSHLSFHRVSKSYTVSKGANFTLNIEKPETDLTPEMIASGSWRSKAFKPYNFSALGVPPVRGHLHPLLKVRAEFRQIFLEMGFSEMPTNRYVESSFWNFDALFQPQQHPARDAHDTFFISGEGEGCSPSSSQVRVRGEVGWVRHMAGFGFGKFECIFQNLLFSSGGIGTRDWDSFILLCVAEHTHFCIFVFLFDTVTGSVLAVM